MVLFSYLFIPIPYIRCTLGYQRVLVALRRAWDPVWALWDPGPARLMAPRTLWAPKVWKTYNKHMPKCEVILLAYIIFRVYFRHTFCHTISMLIIYFYL